MNLKELKLDFLQKIIEKIKFILKNTEDPQSAEILSFSHSRMLTCFFAKKEMELKRQGLSDGYRKLLWSDVRNYSPLTSDGEKELNDCKIPDHIIVTPFTISQDFNIWDYKNKKLSTVKEKEPIKMVELSELKQIQRINDVLPEMNKKILSEKKKVAITEAKYSLYEYLGK